MPRRPRIAPQGTVFHVLNRAARRATLFAHARDYAAFEDLLAEAVVNHDIALFAYCVMPNHWHLLLQPQDGRNLSRFMHWLTVTHARRWQLAHDAMGSGAVYQGRYKAIPVGNDIHFLCACRYVERNALRAALVDRAETWRWSSLAHRHQRRDSPWISGWPVPTPANWVEHVNTPQTTTEIAAIRNAIEKGQPFGSEEWCRDLARQFGIANRRPRGRPRGPTPASTPRK